MAVKVDAYKMGAWAGCGSGLGGTKSTDFNGTNEYISITSTAGDALNFSGGQPFTISFWMELDSAVSQRILERKYSYACLTTSGGLFRFYVMDNNSAAYAQAGAFGALATNTWYHIACTFTGISGWGNHEIYINGVKQVLTGTGADAPWQAANNLDLGRTGTTFPNEMNGRMIHFSAFNKVLSQIDIDQLYNCGDPPSSDQFTASLTNYMVCHLRLDENDDLTVSNGVIDQLGNFPGTGVNMDATNHVTDYP